MWQRLATVRDIHEVGVPSPALSQKSVSEKHRALDRGSSLFAARLRKRYAPPFALSATDVEHTFSSGSATVYGAPQGNAADVRLEIVAGGPVTSGAVTYRMSREDGYPGTWEATKVLPSSGEVIVDGATIAISGTVAAGEFVAYTSGPDPGIRWSVAAIASHSLYYNRGADPKAQEPYRDARDQALAFADALAGGEKAELDRACDSTHQRSEGGPVFVVRTRAGFLTGDN